MKAKNKKLKIIIEREGAGGSDMPVIAPTAKNKSDKTSTNTTSLQRTGGSTSTSVSTSNTQEPTAPKTRSPQFVKYSEDVIWQSITSHNPANPLLPAPAMIATMLRDLLT